MNHFRFIITLIAVVAPAGSLSAAPATVAPAFMPSNPPAQIRAQEPQYSIEAFLRAAYVMMNEKKYDEVLAVCARASRIYPDDYRPQAVMGYAYKEQLKYKSASEAFGKALLLAPDVKLLYIAKAIVDSGRNARDEAIATCRKALEIDPEYAEAYAMIGSCLRYEKTRRDEAVAAYRSAVKYKPGMLGLYEDLGDLLEEANDLKGAEEIFRQGLETDPKHRVGRFALGRLLVKQGRLAEARKIWDDRTANEDDHYPQFIVVLERAEKLKQATDALAAKPNDPAALTDLGMAVMEGDSWVFDGRHERAIVYFRKALALKPAYAQAQYGICKAYIQIADVDRDKKSVVDRELAKLRRLSASLADEMVDYRKSFSGRIGGVPGGVPVNLNR